MDTDKENDIRDYEECLDKQYKIVFWGTIIGCSFAIVIAIWMGA